METFLLVYNCFVFVLFVGVMAFTDDKRARPLFFALSVVQALDIVWIKGTLDIVRMIRG